MLALFCVAGADIACVAGSGVVSVVGVHVGVAGASVDDLGIFGAVSVASAAGVVRVGVGGWCCLNRWRCLNLCL